MRRRQWCLNLLSASATIALLLTIAACARADAARTNGLRYVGIATDAWHVDDASRAVGGRFDVVMTFEAWARNRTLKDWFAAARDRGARVMVSWEPWHPVPIDRADEQSRVQEEWSNGAIVAGRHDHYIRRFARAVRAAGVPVYLRLMHEMNGVSYPWSADPKRYRAAWRRVWRIFHQEGASNAVFVWSVNPNSYEDDRTFMRRVRSYWPGRRYVDQVGSTLIRFGGRRKNVPLAFYFKRIGLLRTFRRPVVLTEVNVNYEDRLRWLRELRVRLRQNRWVRGLVWSQQPSRGERRMQGIGRMDWDIATDPRARRLLRAIIADRPRG